MFTRALQRLHTRRRRLIAPVGVALALVVAPMVLMPVTASATIADSPFNGLDHQIDPVNLVGAVNPDTPSGSGDNSYVGGSKEDTTCPGVTTGSIPPNKDDLKGFYVATAKGQTSGDTYLYLAWTRANVLGTATMDFELNKSSDLVDCNGVNAVRTVGDLLFTYDFQGGQVDAIQYRTWGGSSWSGPVDILQPGVSEGSISDDMLSGEMVIDMDAAGIFHRNVCVNFAGASLKSRASSSSFQDQLKDFIASVPKTVSNCGSLKVTKAVSGGLAGDTFPFVVSCPGVDLNGDAAGTTASFSLADKGSQQFDNLPLGTVCSVTETRDPAKWWTTYSVDSAAHDGASVSGIGIVLGTTTAAFTNTRQTDSLTISKSAVGGDGTFLFDVDCSDNRFDRLGANPVSITTHDGSGSAVLSGIPTGTTCTVTERSNGLFTSSPASASATITSDGAQVAFTNTAKPIGITLDKKVNGADHASSGDALPAHEGDALAYTVRITNSGQVPLTISSLTDSLKAGWAATCAQGVGSTLNPGNSISCSYPATAGSTDAHNVAAVAAVDGLGRPASASDGTYVHILAPAISVTKTGPANVHVGDSVDYTIVVVNSGNTPLHNVTVSDPKCDAAPTTSDNDGELGIGESWTYHCSRVAQAGDAPDILNTATASGTDPLGKPVSATANATTNVLIPVIEVTKTGPAMAQVGDTLTYDIVVHNAGNTPLTSVVVTDAKCAGLAGNGDGELGVDESWTYHCTHVVADGDGNQYVNNVHASGQDLLHQTVSDDDSWSTDILRPVIDVTKSGEATAHVGDTIHYTIQVHNAGNTALSPVAVTDPGCTNLASDDADGTLGVGETWNFECTHVVVDGDGVRYTNTIHVAGSDALKREVTDEASWPTDILRPMIDVTKTGPDMAHVGDTLQYTIMVTNTGTTPLSPVSVTDGGCSGLASNDADGTLGIGESWTYHCGHVVTAEDGSQYTNTVHVSGEDSLHGVVTADDSWPTDILVPGISVTKSGDAQAHVGDSIVYTIVVGNAGNTPLSGVQVTDPGCTGLSSDDADQELGVEESWTFHCTHIVVDIDGNRYVNSVTASGLDALERKVTDDASWPTDILRPTISVTKTGPAQLHVGDTATYTIVVTNTGNTPLHDVTVLDPKCDATPPSSTDDDGTLSPGESWTYHCSHVVVDGDGGQILNTATADGTDPLDEVVHGAANHPSDILRPAIAVTKTGASTVHVGDPVVYTIVVTNPGNTPLADVKVTDPKCDGAPVRSTDDADGLLSPGEAWTYHCTHVATAGDGASILNTAKAEGTDPLGQTVTNTANHTAAVLHPAIAIDKTANPVSVSGSGSVTYSYVVTNTGDTTLFNVLVTDDILGPIGIVASLAPGESVTLFKTVDVDTTTPPTNVGTAVGTDVLGEKVTASDSATITVVLAEVVTRPEPAKELPRTGGPLQTETRAAITLIEVGLLLELSAWRRRRTRRRAD